MAHEATFRWGFSVVETNINKIPINREWTTYAVLGRVRCIVWHDPFKDTSLGTSQSAGKMLAKQHCCVVLILMTLETVRSDGP
jgi:hypothetical protein